MSSRGRTVVPLARLFEEGAGALSTQVLDWIIHCPAHAGLLKAAQLGRRYKLGWWDALILTSAIEPGCAVLWTEDFSDGRRLGPITVRNPFQ